MMKTYILVVVVMLGLASGAYGAPLIIGKGGQAQCVIEVSATATLPEQTAASELQTYLGKVIGSKPELRVEGEAVTGQRIVVGHTAFTRAHGIDVDALGSEEWIIRTIDGSLVLTGGRPRGVLYAVYRFLEDVVGVRWWNPWEESVPSNPDQTISGQNRQGKPVFQYRDIYMIYGMDNGRFAMRNRLNRDGDWPISKEYGGGRDYGPPYHVHTFYMYIPPKDYFAEHPEYFSLINGKRMADQHQLCLSNSELRQLFIRKLAEYIEQAEKREAKEGIPAPVVYNISPNDCGGQCQCADCQAIVKREGSEAGLLLDFVNEIADSIRQTHPEIYIDTLAYAYYERPPKHIKPRDNVIIRLCDIHGNPTFPVTHPKNRTFHDFIQEWSRVSKNLRIWNYAITFGQGTGLPFPSADMYAETYRFYLKNNVEGVFTEHEEPILADVRDFKIWMMMKTLEDPYRDDKELARTFANGFYGSKAGPIFLQYRSLLRQSQNRHGTSLLWFAKPSDFIFMDVDTTIAAHKLFEQGAKMIKGDPVLERRWRHARLSLDRVTYFRFRDLVGEWVAKGNAPETFPLDCGEVVSRVRQTWGEQIDTRIYSVQQPAEREKMEAELAFYTTIQVK